MAPFDNGYSSNIINKLSPLIEGQVPDFIQADHSVFVRFLKHYYQYLESGELRLSVSIDNMLLEVQTESFLLLEDGNKLVLESSVGKFSANETITGATSKATATVLVDDLGNSTKPRLFISSQQQFQTGETVTGGTSSATGTVIRYRANPVQNLQQLLEYANTDNTIYDFLDQLRESFMNAIPKNLTSGLDQRNLIKNIRELYRAKGTSEGHKIFLRMLLGQSSDIMYPNQFMMRASDGNWGYQNILRCSPGANAEPDELVGQVVTGQTSGATAVVASAISTAEGTDLISKFEINPASLVGTFVDGETIQGVSTVQDITMSFTVRGMVTSYNVTDGGKLYSAGDDLDLDGQSTIGNGEATAEVGSIKQGSVSRVIIDDVGSNYRVGDPLTFTTTETSTSTKAATGFVSVIDGSLAIDGTDSSSTDVGDNLILEDGSTSSFVSIGSIICEDATGTGTQFLILDRSNTSGANVGAQLSLGDQLTLDSYGTANDTFALESGTIKSIDVSANIGEIAKVFVKDGGSGYSLLPSVSVTSSLGSSAALLSDTNNIGAVDSVNVTNQGFKYTVAPEGRFRANFLLKDVSGTFAFGNTLTTAGLTGTVQSFNSTTKVLKTTFEDVERVTMETGDSNTIELENATEVTIDGRTVGFSLADRASETDFKIDNHLDGEGDLLLETGDSILMDASDEVGIIRFVAEDNLNNVFLIRENGDPAESIINSRVDGPGNGFISEIMGNPNPIPPTSNTPVVGDRVVLETATTSGTDFLVFDGTDVNGTNAGSRILFETHGPTPVNYIRPINSLRGLDGSAITPRSLTVRGILNVDDFAITVDENDSLRTDNSLVLGALGDMRLLLEDATANVGDKLIGERTGNSIILNGSDDASPQANILSRLLGDEEALSGNIEIDGTDSDSADVGDDIVFEDGIDFSSETLTITDSGGATGTIVSVDIAKGTSSIGTIAETTAAYSNIESLIGEALNRIQDSVYYQQFAYEVQTGAGQGEYLDELKKAVHPAGFNIFGKVSIATLVSAAIPVAGSSLGGGYTADTDTFSPILASTFEILFAEHVKKEHKAITRPVAGYDDKLVLETDNPTGELALEAATVSTDETGRLISETENVIGARILLETSSLDNSLYLILNASDTSGSNDGDRIVAETAESQSFTLALEPTNTINGGDFLPGATIPSVSSFLLESGTTNANTGDKLELETDTPNCGRQNSFFTFDVTRNDRVLDEDGANQYLETAGVGYRNSAGERGLVISRIVAKINLPNRNVNSIPTGAVFLGQNVFENELGGISLEVGKTGGGGTGALTLNGFNQVNSLGNVDRVTATGDKLQLQTTADSNVGSGATFKDYGEYINDSIVLNGSDGSSSNAGDNFTLEAGTLTNTKHRFKSMTATDVLIGETRLVKSFHRIRDIIRPPRLSVNRHINGEDFNLVSEVSEIGTIQLEDATSSESTRDFLLLEDGVGVGFNNRLSLEKQFLIPEDFTANLDSGVIPTENFTNSDLEPRHYSSDVAKRPLGAISFESTGAGVVHLRLEDGTVGVIVGSHRPAGDGFLVSEGELQTTEDIDTGVITTLINENIRYGMEVSLHSANGAEQGLGHGVFALNRAPKGDNNNIGERLIMESATILDYLENTGAVATAVSNEFSFDNTSIRFDQTGFTYDSTI
jgi:hypothetical protein